jgi:hypothetical protein
MPNGLRPRVAEILRSEHRTDPAAIRALGNRDAAELLEIASGATHQEFRIKAMTLLAAARQERAGELFRDAMRDQEADDTVRAAGATWLSRVAAAEEAEPSLIDALAAESTPVVRHKIIAGLARIGAHESLDALSTAIDQSDAGLREHAEFARSVVAYRLGRTGFELPVFEPSELLPAPSPATSSATFEAPGPEATLRIVDQIADDSYGVPTDNRNSTWLRCDRQQLAIVLSAHLRDSPGALLIGPTVAGLVALQAETDGSLHTGMIVLSWPQEESRVYISVNRPTGRAMYFGHGQVEGESVPFRLDAVRGPGARETTIIGTVVDGALTALQVGMGHKLVVQHPTPAE